VRGYVAVAAGIAAVLVACLTSLLALREARQARRRAAVAVEHQARLAAMAVEGSLAASLALVAGTAAEPGFLAAASSPVCSLAGGGGQHFPSGHLDVVRLDGVVLCSSLAEHGAPVGASYAGAPWLATLAPREQPFWLGPYADRLVAGRRAVAAVAPLRGSDGRVAGAFLSVLHLDPLARSLAGVYGGPSGYGFTVTRARDGEVLASTPPRHGAVLAGAAAPTITAAAPVRSVGWRLTAAVAREVALAPAVAAWQRMGLVGGAALAVTLALGVVLHRRVAAPLARLTAAIERVGEEASPHPVPEEGPRDLVELARAFNRMTAARVQYETELLHQSLHDHLTGLPNRALLLDRMGLALKRMKRGAGSVAVLFVDLDRFAILNQAFGHAIGDRVLVTVAERLGALLPTNATLARFGSDKFVALCDSVRSREETTALAERMLATLRAPVEVGDVTATVTASIGIALTTAYMVTAESVLRKADSAKEQARAAGGDRSSLFVGELGTAARQRVRLESDLRRALERGDLVMHYQPEVELTTGRVVGLEALVRWPHAELGLLLAGSFVPVAEETGLIVPLTRLALEIACEQAVRWQGQDRAVAVSVNLSPKLIVLPGLRDQIEDILSRSGLAPGNLCLELTESTLVQPHVEHTLLGLKELGVRLAIDDFGTGYSALAYVERLPVDQLKIDQAFIAQLRRHHTGVVPAILDIAHHLDLQVVAEGVEEQHQVAALLALGCPIGQGFLLAPPAPAKVADRLVETGVTVPS
jgi:diguanylate cyclase (GGDEF)-like protein